jgi:methylthioribose-1-phosphate isomerase
VIEQRDPQQVLCYRGIANTLPGVKAIYPAFDITPPYLIDGIVTDQGVYSAYDLDSYFAKGQNAFY